MTVNELIKHLSALPPADRAAEVMYGPEGSPPEAIAGGIITQRRGARAGRFLLLSPIPLDQVGGF